MNTEIYIFGTGAHARKVYHCAIQAGFAVVAFVDEKKETSDLLESLSVLSSEGAKNLAKAGSIFIAIGASEVRQRLIGEFTAHGWSFPPIVHPKANVAPGVKLEEGVLIAAGALIESGSVIGRGSIIDIGVVIDHDCFIPPFSHLRPGVVCQSFTKWDKNS